MRRTHNFFIILFLGLFLNENNFCTGIDENQKNYLQQIETTYEEIMGNPNLTEDDRKFLSTSQRAWKVYLERELTSYMLSSQSELNDEILLEKNILKFENSKLKNRLEVLKNMNAKLQNDPVDNKKKKTVYGIKTTAAPGGYNTNNYPHSNVDIENTKHIADKGYQNARKAVFTTSETNKSSNTNLQYAQLFGNWGKYSGSGSSYTYDTYGALGTTFHRFSSNLLAGLNYGYAYSEVDYNNLYGSSEEINTFGINTYLTYQKDKWLITGQAGYSISKHNLKRYTVDENLKDIVGVSDFKRKLDKRFESNAYTIGLEIGYNYKINDKSYFYPYIGADYMWNSRESYTENADNWAGKVNIIDGNTLAGYAVNVDKNDYNTAVSKLGIMGQTAYKKWTFTGEVTWMYHFSDYSNVTGTYQELSNSEFVANKLNPGKNVAYILLGTGYSLSEQLKAGLNFAGYYRNKQKGSQTELNLTYNF